jgi:hypothetical protein
MDYRKITIDEIQELDIDFQSDLKDKKIERA